MRHTAAHRAPRPAPLHLLLAAGLLVGPPSLSCTSAGRAQPGTAAARKESTTRTAGRPSQASRDAELALLQGRWEREEAPQGDRPYRKVVKQINGNRESITHLDRDGKVVQRHTVDFQPGRIGDVKVFTYRNLEVTDGPEKGTKNPGPFSYLYRADDEHFVEVWGLLPGQENRPVQMWEWTRAEPPTPSGGSAK